MVDTLSDAISVKRKVSLFSEKVSSVMFTEILRTFSAGLRRSS